MLQRRPGSIALSSLLSLLSLSTSSVVRAQAATEHQVSAGAGQQAMSITASADGYVARACAQSPCSSGPSVEAKVPARFKAGGAASFRDVALERGRKAVVAVMHDPESQQRWVTVLAGPLAAGEPPRVLFNELGDPDQRGSATEPSSVQIVAQGGASRLLVASRGGGLSLCGRPGGQAVRALDPSSLELKAVKTERLDASEKSRARKLVATKQSSPRKPPLGRLLAATGASSGKASPSLATDGDVETFWSAQPGDARGELLTMRAPRAVPLVSLSITVRPKTAGVEQGASPRKFYLVTDDNGLYEVSLPEDGFAHPGQAYEVKLPEPVSTECVALVLDEAYGGKDPKASAVTLTEVEARSDLDDKTDLPGLVHMLSGGGEGAKAAQAVLMRGGRAARQAVAESYAGLDDAGRVMALDVADQGSCDESAEIYVKALGSSFEAEAIHGRTRIERCRKAAVPALLAAVRDESHPARMRAAEELSVLSPGDTLETLFPLLANGALPKPLRVSMVRAARSPRGAATLAKLLAEPGQPGKSTLALLRAGSDRLGEEAIRPSASQALARVAAPGSPFDDRYLALEPAARLAEAGDAGARSLLEAALADADPHLRAAAARLSGKIAPVRQRLLALPQDPEPRVREAAAQALASPDDAASRGALAGLLGDEWTFVRQAAYDALAQAGADPQVDQALIDRLGSDPSPVALARAVEATSARKVAQAGPALLKLAEDDKQPIEVRARAARALGSVCFRQATDRLTAWARAGADLHSTVEAQELSSASLVALGRLHPADLEARIAPFRGEGTSRAAREAAKSAIEEKERCQLRSYARGLFRPRALDSRTGS